MAKKISQLTQATQVKSDDVTVIVQDGETKKLPLNMMVTKQDIENKKVAGLAKLDEIEATYENDTYTPTIAVKNKSSVKVGEGDGVDYSANVMDGHVKSAILKGQTLVNLLNDDNIEQRQASNVSSICGYDKETLTFHFITNLNHPYNHSYVSTYNGDKSGVVKYLKNNTDYTIMWYGEKIKDDDDSKTFIRVGASENNYGNPSVFTNEANIKTGKILYRTQTSYADNIVRLLGIKIVNVSNDIEYKLRFVILEGDYTNVDIPYFEGIQSVKLPVLTTIGKNLFDYTYWYPLILHNFDYTITGNKINTIIPSGQWFLETARANFDNLKEDTIYTISATSVNSQITILFWKPDGTLIFEKGVRNTPITFTTPNEPFVVSVRFCRRLDSDNTVDVQASCENIQIEEGSTATPYEPYKSNILSTSEDVTLRGIGDVRDTLDCLTGEVTERISEVVLVGSENWNINYQGNSDLITFSLNQFPTNIAEHSFNNCKNFLISDSLPIVTDYQNNKGILSHRIGGNHWVVITVNRSDLISEDVVGFKQFLSTNPVTIQYQLAQESVKTVDLMPSGTHPSTTPYCWKNGHIQLSSSGLLPNLEYSVVTSRAGQINQNATMIVKNDKRIFDLEILLAGGLVNTTYQALTLQNQVETGLSKVSLNSETEPDYLLYHMIMKLIEEKAYKLDDLTEKVSVFYLYEKLSDEQFEIIYSALYPFAEDEIIEEPVVEELPEVVEDEVIM